MTNPDKMDKATKMKRRMRIWRFDEQGQPSRIIRAATYFLFFFIVPMLFIVLAQSNYDKYVDGKLTCRYFSSIQSSTGSFSNRVWEGPSKITIDELYEHVSSGETVISLREMNCENGRLKK